jgi:hypothetical protein
MSEYDFDDSNGDDDFVENVPDDPDILHGIVTEMNGVLEEYIPFIQNDIANMMLSNKYSAMDICYEIGANYGLSFALSQYFYNCVANDYGSAIIENNRINQTIAEETEALEKEKQQENFDKALKEHKALFNKNRQMILEDEEVRIAYKAPDGISRGFTIKEPVIKHLKKGEITFEFHEDDNENIKKIIDWMIKWKEIIKIQNEFKPESDPPSTTIPKTKSSHPPKKPKKGKE